MASTIPIAEGLFTWPSASPRLIGGRCTACGTTTFPMQGSCPKCTGRDIQEHLLPPTGTLWSYTVQNFQPKAPYAGPEVFEPYGVGYVQLADEVIVESRLTEHVADHLQIGLEMELVIVPFRQDDQGDEVVTFAFRPAGAPGGQQ